MKGQTSNFELPTSNVERGVCAGWAWLWPTKHLTGAMFLLVAIWYTAASQSNGVAYLLLFVVAVLVAISAPHTWLNLGGLKAVAEAARPAFAGQEVAVPLEIQNTARQARRALVVTLPETKAAPELVEEVPAGRAARVEMRFPSPRRGEHELREVQLGSIYPLGFWRVRKRLPVAQRYLVYPRPEGDATLPAVSAGAARGGAVSWQAGEDFAGVRAYVPGESQRHIDWKAVARGQAMMTKQFATETVGELALDLSATPAGGKEARLSQLALWVIEAERAHRRYSLRLPHVTIPASLGEAHCHRCLAALARCP